MLLEGQGLSFIKQEKTFIDYFHRCKDAGMTKDNISDILPQLEPFYKKMVIDKTKNNGELSVYTLFINWSNSTFGY